MSGVPGTDGPPAGAPPLPAGAIEVAARAEWADVDLVGVVRYGAYPRLLDLAEAELFRAAGLAYPRLGTEYGLVLVRRVLHLEYLAPARYDDALRVAIWVEGAGSSSLTFGVAVRDATAGVTHVTGRVVTVAVDAATLGRVALPASLVERLRGAGARREPLSADTPPA